MLERFRVGKSPLNIQLNPEVAWLWSKIAVNVTLRLSVPFVSQSEREFAEDWTPPLLSSQYSTFPKLDLIIVYFVTPGIQCCILVEIIGLARLLALFESD